MLITDHISFTTKDFRLLTIRNYLHIQIWTKMLFCLGSKRWLLLREVFIFFVLRFLVISALIFLWLYYFYYYYYYYHHHRTVLKLECEKQNEHFILFLEVHFVQKGTRNMTEICNPFSQNATISMSSCYA